MVSRYQARPAQNFLIFPNLAHRTLQVFFRGAMSSRGRHRPEWLVSANVLYLKVEQGSKWATKTLKRTMLFTSKR